MSCTASSHASSPTVTWCRSSSRGPAGTAIPSPATPGACWQTSSTTTSRSKRRAATTASSSPAPAPTSPSTTPPRDACVPTPQDAAGLRLSQATLGTSRPRGLRHNDYFYAGAGRVPKDRRAVRRRRGGPGGGVARRARRVSEEALQAPRGARLSRPALSRSVRRRRGRHGDVLPLRGGAGPRLPVGGRGGGDAVLDGDLLRLQVRIRGAPPALPGAGAPRRPDRDV